MPRSSPALDTAREFLRRTIANLERQGRSRLPSTRVLADKAGVSPVTMGKAVRSLREKDRIEVCPGRGIHLKRPMASAPNDDSEPVLPGRINRDTLAEAILAGIHNGTWTERLPTQKELAVAFGTTPKTVRYALSILRERGFLGVRRRRYSLHQDPVAVNQPTISLVVNSDAGSDPTGRRRTVVEFIERQAHRHGLGVRYWAFRDRSNRAVVGLTRNIQAGQESDQGIVYVSSGFWVPSSLALLRSLAKLRVPLFLYSDAEPSHEARQIVNSEFTTLLYTQPYTGEAPGHDAGCYLAGLGHTSVVYLSDEHEQSWSHMRLKGLARALSRSVRPGSCVPVVRDTPSEANVSPPPAELAKDVPFIDRQERMHLLASTKWRTRAAQLEPLFERALSCSAATAWVCGNDATALLAIDFLRKRGIGIPEDISVLGFDDILEAHQESLTSHRFKELELAQVLFTHLTNTTLFHAAKRKHEAIMTGGNVVVRCTCGPPRTAW